MLLRITLMAVTFGAVVLAAGCESGSPRTASHRTSISFAQGDPIGRALLKPGLAGQAPPQAVTSTRSELEPAD